MKAHWQAEKEAIAAIRALKEELEAKRAEVEREADLERAAEIRYGQIPELERQVDEATKRARRAAGRARRCSRRRSTRRTSPRS